MAPAHKDCLVGVEEQLAIPGRVAVRRDVDPGAATDLAVVFIEPGVQPPDLLRPSAIRAVQFTGEAPVVAHHQAGGQDVIDAEEPTERTEVDLKRRGDEEDDVAGFLMAAQRRHRVRSEPGVVHHASEGGRMATDFGNRATPERRSRSEYLQRIAIAPQNSGGSLACLSQ